MQWRKWRNWQKIASLWWFELDAKSGPLEAGDSGKMAILAKLAILAKIARGLAIIAINVPDPWRLAILAKKAIVAKLAILAKIARNACNGENGKKLPASGDLNWIPKVRIYCLLYFNLAFFFYEFCDFPQIVWSDAIWGQLCKIAPSCNIRWPVFAIKTLLIPKYSQLALWRTLLKGTLPASH